MDKYGVKSTHEAIKKKLLDFIETFYLGKNDALRAACIDELEQSGLLFQEPYIEANHAYLQVNNGIENANIPTEAKQILKEMIKRNLGVFTNPYLHQVESLEQFYAGKDLLISTGTGSGKTECFMWPMVTKLVTEQILSPNTWEKRGVRTIMLYPMNALVSDQMGRLRKMIGNRDHGFSEIIDKMAHGSRIPKFGMYTGRTPYPGLFDKNKNKEYASTLRKDIISQSNEVKTKLWELGKYPSKDNLENFVSHLENDESIYINEKDAEFVTRHEMQNCCPDILITNYSMLEYMLMRPIEASIWESTRQWLASSEQNKLLFIIDEAHMYRGSSGGEVALLIRRVLYKLGIGRNRVQFILTSASVPAGNDDKIYEFACNLSAQDSNNNSFVIIRGKDEPIEENGISIDPNLLFDFDIDSLSADWDIKKHAIKDFATRLNIKLNCNFDDIQSVENWLYDSLYNLNPMKKIMKVSRGNAISLEKLAKKTFPEIKTEIAEKATSVLLAIAPLAKNKDDRVLYPARLHMMFRGLQGIFACSNPACTCKTSGKNTGLGKIYLQKPGTRCKCGGMIYELFNERSCGALFLHGFIDSTEENPFVWSEKGEVNYNSKNELKEVFFYIIPNDGSFKRKKDIKVAWLNTITGRLDMFNDHSNNNEFIQVAYNNADSGENKKKSKKYQNNL